MKKTTCEQNKSNRKSMTVLGLINALKRYNQDCCVFIRDSKNRIVHIFNVENLIIDTLIKPARDNIYYIENVGDLLNILAKYDDWKNVLFEKGAPIISIDQIEKNVFIHTLN